MILGTSITQPGNFKTSSKLAQRQHSGRVLLPGHVGVNRVILVMRLSPWQGRVMTRKRHQQPQVLYVHRTSRNNVWSAFPEVQYLALVSPTFMRRTSARKPTPLPLCPPSSSCALTQLNTTTSASLPCRHMDPPGWVLAKFIMTTGIGIFLQDLCHRTCFIRYMSMLTRTPASGIMCP